MNNPLPHSSRLLLTALLCGSNLAPAQESLAPVIVTASRSAETADQTLASVTVIDREEIIRSQATDISELLAGLPGVNIAANGGDGKTKNLFLRGTTSNHTLLLIDGIRIGSASLGSPSWALIPLDDVERIEVVRGPRSSLYGSDAIGGVIQIFTRKQSRESAAELEAGYGSDNHQKLSARLSDGSEHYGYHLALSRERSDGFDSHRDTENDDDGFESNNFSGGVSYRLSDRLELSANLLRAQGTNEFDGVSFSGNSSDFLQQSAGIALQAQVSDAWQSTLRLGQSRDQSEDFFNGSFVTRFNTRRDQLSWENSIGLSDSSELVAGFDYLNDQVGGSTAYQVSERENRAIFAQYRFYGEQQDLQIGLRRDDNQQFGGKTTGNIGWGWGFSDKLRFTASVGTAFNAPTFNQLYWPATSWSSGNPNLQPEESRSYEMGLEGRQAGIHWSVRVYQNRIENLIDWACTALCYDADPWNDFWQPSNVNSARINGLEIQAKTRLGGWETRATVNLLDPEDESTGNILPKRSERSLRLDADRSFGAWRFGGTLLAEGGRWNDPANSVRLGGYTTLDLRASYRLSPHWLMRGTIDNLFDRQYQTVDGFPMPDREFFLALVYQQG